MKKARIKKVTTVYYDLNGNEDHSETEYYEQVKYPIIGWVTGSFGWSSINTAKERLIEKLGNKQKIVEYIDV